MKPYISVVIPCFNAEKWVARAVESVLRQNVPGIEIVVVDDGSTDGSSELLEAFGQSVVLVKQPNSGVASARRTGVGRASGRYIKFLDADDVVPEGGLEHLRTAIIQCPGVAFIGRSREVDAEGGGLGNRMYNIGYQPEDMTDIRCEFLLTQATHMGLWLIPRGLFARIDLFGEDKIHMGEEYGFCMRMIDSRVPIKYLDAHVYEVFVHDSPTRLSRSADDSRHLKQVEQIKAAVEFIKKELPAASPDSFQQIARLCWSRGRHCFRINCVQATKAYFELARLIDPDVRPVGSAVYRALCRVLGPGKSEAALQGIKSVLRPGVSR